MKPLSEVRAEREPLDTPAAIAGRLSDRQADILRKMAAEPNRGFTAGDLGTTGSTLVSMSDFERGKRDILPPLILITYERGEPSGQRFWSVAKLGLEVVEHLDERVAA